GADPLRAGRARRARRSADVARCDDDQRAAGNAERTCVPPPRARCEIGTQRARGRSVVSCGGRNACSAYSTATRIAGTVRKHLRATRRSRQTFAAQQRIRAERQTVLGEDDFVEPEIGLRDWGFGNGNRESVTTVRHSGESRNPSCSWRAAKWIPACAGMTSL